jgi:hypothetical protein
MARASDAQEAKITLFSSRLKSAAAKTSRGWEKTRVGSTKSSQRDAGDGASDPVFRDEGGSSDAG